MLYRTSLAVSGVALSAFLMTAAAVAQGSYPTPSGRVDANGMPTDHSTPAERAQTSALNNQVRGANQAADAQAQQNDAQYQASQQQYQGQLQQNQAAQQQYQDQKTSYENQTAAYENLRSRYAAERSAYHRDVWPERYTSWRIERDARLIGQRVEITNGAHVGTVTDVARFANGKVEALRVQLDGGKVVWIDEADIRYDRTDGIVMTNLNRADLHEMADERF